MKRAAFITSLLFNIIIFQVSAYGQSEEGIKIGVEVKADSKALGSAISKFLDKQEKELSEVADVERTGDSIIIKMNEKDAVLFDFDSFELKESAKSKINKWADILFKNPEYVSFIFVVKGHTDGTGEFEYNQTLSENRAKAVANYLISKGFKPESITKIVGYGETAPVASNDTPEGRKQNRRVEIDITIDRQKFKESHPVIQEPKPCPTCIPCPEEEGKRYTDKMSMEVGGRVSFTGIIAQNRSKEFRFLLGPYWGIFVVKSLEIGLNPVFDYYYYNGPVSGDKTVKYLLGIFLSIGYVFDLHKVVYPYLQLNIGGSWGRKGTAGVDLKIVDVTENALGLGPEVGLKFVVGKNGIISLGFQYLYENAGYSNAPRRVNRHTFLFVLGFGFWF